MQVTNPEAIVLLRLPPPIVQILAGIAFPGIGVAVHKGSPRADPGRPRRGRNGTSHEERNVTMLFSLMQHWSRHAPGVGHLTVQQKKRNPPRGRRRGAVLTAALCAALGLVTAPAAVAGPAVPAPAVPT